MIYIELHNNTPSTLLLCLDTADISTCHFSVHKYGLYMHTSVHTSLHLHGVWITSSFHTSLLPARSKTFLFVSCVTWTSQWLSSLLRSQPSTVTSLTQWDRCLQRFVCVRTYLCTYVCIYLQHSSATSKHCVVIMASGVWFTNGREVRQTSLCFHFVSFRRPTSHPLPRPPVAVSGPVLLPRKAALDLLSLTGKWPIATANTPPVHMHTKQTAHMVSQSLEGLSSVVQE